MNLYLVFLFFFGGALGWVIDTLDRSITCKRFAEASALHIPFLPIYGIGIVLLVVGKPFFPSFFILKFLSISLLLALLEYAGGVFTLLVFKRRLWNYKTKGSLQGYTDIWHAMTWGVLGILFYRLNHSCFLSFKKLT